MVTVYHFLPLKNVPDNLCVFADWECLDINTMDTVSANQPIGVDLILSLSIKADNLDSDILATHVAQLSTKHFPSVFVCLFALFFVSVRLLLTDTCFMLTVTVSAIWLPPVCYEDHHHYKSDNQKYF